MFCTNKVLRIARPIPSYSDKVQPFAEVGWGVNTTCIIWKGTRVEVGGTQGFPPPSSSPLTLILVNSGGGVISKIYEVRDQ